MKVVNGATHLGWTIFEMRSLDPSLEYGWRIVHLHS